jgi:outer membrane immunogenic protein
MTKRALLASVFAFGTAVAPVSAGNWSGFYIGGHVGGAFGDVEVTGVSEGTNFVQYAPVSVFEFDPDGVVGGGQLGFNFQWAQWVLGAEATIAGLDFDEALVNPNDSDDTLSVEVEWLATAAARLGFSWGASMLYAKGGYATGDVNHRYEDAGGGPTGFYNTNETHHGFVAGAGLEHQISDNVSAGIEYNYIDLGETDHSAVAVATGGGAVGGPIVADVDAQIHSVTARLNWHFWTP